MRTVRGTKQSWKTVNKVDLVSIRRSKCKNPSKTIKTISVSNDLLIDCQKAAKLPQISSTNWCLYDGSCDKFYGFRQHYQREVASLTKIMTVMVVINLLERYQMQKDVIIKISKNASILIGTSAQLPQKFWITIEDLLYGAMLPSGNDAAYLLAEVFGLLIFYEQSDHNNEYKDIESIDISLYENTQPFVIKFLRQMNKKAKQLKMYKTSYANPHGLANSLNYSSAYDVLILSRYAASHPLFRQIMNTQEYEYNLMNEKLEVVDTKIWVNTNKLLGRGWQGVKTGQTIPAGCCLSSVKDNVFIILLNANNIELRFDQTEKLYRWYRQISLEQQLLITNEYVNQ